MTLQSLAAKVSTASDFANIGRKIEWVSSWRKNIAKFSKRLAETGNVSYHQGWEFALSVFRANRSFFAQKCANELFAQKYELFTQKNERFAKKNERFAQKN